MDAATTNVADFKPSVQFQRYGKIVSIFDYFVLDDNIFNQKHFFICVLCDPLSKNIKLYLCC